MKQDPPGYDFQADLKNHVFGLKQLKAETGLSDEQIQEQFSPEQIDSLLDTDSPQTSELRRFLRLSEAQEPESSTSSPSGQTPPSQSSPTDRSSPTT